MRKKDRHFLYAMQMQQSAIDAERRSAYQARKSAEERLEFDKQVHKDNLRVKDRVDLSLSQYEEMKSKIAVLEDQVQRQQAVLEAIGINPSLVKDIIPESVLVSSSYNIKDNLDTVQIEFECYRNLNCESIIAKDDRIRL